MTPSLAVQDDLRDKVQRFVHRRALPLEVCAEAANALRILRAPEGQRPQCDPHTLHAGGWIACPTALEIARTLNVAPPDLGALLDLLDIKVRACSLGCFP